MKNQFTFAQQYAGLILPPDQNVQNGQLMIKSPAKKPGQTAQSRYRRQAPLAAPGTYLVRLTAGETVLTKKLVIEKDDPGYIGR